MENQLLRAGPGYPAERPTCGKRGAAVSPGLTSQCLQGHWLSGGQLGGPCSGLEPGPPWAPFTTEGWGPATTPSKTGCRVTWGSLSGGQRAAPKPARPPVPVLTDIPGPGPPPAEVFIAPGFGCSSGPFSGEAGWGRPLELG